MISLYNIKFASQEFELVENTFITKAKDFQKAFSKNQEIILQTQIKATNNVFTFNISNFNNVIVSNFVDVL